MIFTHGQMVSMISQKPVVWNKQNMVIIYIVLTFGWRSFLFLFIFGAEKKIPEFFTAIFGPKLPVIVINNYWTKHNIEKIVLQRKDTSS